MQVQITPMQLYEGMQTYIPFTEMVFNYLNGRVNPNNRCRLFIQHYHQVDYAHFRKPNSVFFMLGSVINNMYYEPNRDLSIKGLIITCLAHELSHADQCAAMLRYKVDTNYMQFVEYAANLNAWLFMNSHMDEIVAMIGFNPLPSMERFLTPRCNSIMEFSYREFYINTIMYVLITDMSIMYKVSSAFDHKRTVFVLNDYELILRDNGRDLPVVSTFDTMINNVITDHENVIFKYLCKLDVDRVTDTATLNISVTDLMFSPIVL